MMQMLLSLAQVPTTSPRVTKRINFEGGKYS